MRFIFCLLVACAAAAAIAASPRAHVDELSAGQTGYGLTVFAGSQPDTFGVTILGVQRGARVGGDIIMVELSGHGLETSAVAQGMSGSPVYLDDGRLVGAVAFGWGGALRPIAGVTPAVDLDSARDRELVAAVGHGAAGTGVSAVDLAFPATGQLASRLLGGEVAAASPPGNAADRWPTPERLARDLLPLTSTTTTTGDLQPLAMSLVVNPVGTAAGASGATAATLVPGSACAVTLVGGDAQLGAIGTVSLVEGTRMVCMAHPFMQFGPVELPLASAEIITMFPSRQMSFKMGAAGEPIGRITHDVRAGLAGELGVMAPTTPVAVTIDGPEGRSRHRFDVARHPQLTPALVFWCLYNSVLAGGDDRSDQLVRYEMDIALARADGAALPALSLRGATGGSGGVGAMAADWQTPLSILLNNRHEPVTVASIDARLQVERPVRALTVSGLRAPRVIGPGETIAVEVRLAERHGDGRTERFTLQIPESLPEGPLRLGVASAREFFQFDALRAGGLFADHGLATTIERLNQPRSLDDLMVAIVTIQPGFTSDGRELSRLPGSVRRTLAGAASPSIQPTMASYLARDSRRLEALVLGNAVADLTVRATPTVHREGVRP